MNTLNSTSTSKSVINNNSKIDQKCGKGYDSCIIGGKDSITYEHISCCSKKGYCGLSDDHCGKGCQSEFGSCYSHHNIPITQSSPEITIFLTTLPATTSSMSISSIESTESISITTESIPITKSTKSTSITKSSHTKSTSFIESTSIAESPITTTHVKNTKSTKYIIKTTTVTIP